VIDFKPWQPVEYTEKECNAVKALAEGLADDEQQRVALRWIVEKAGFAYEQTYFPGSARDTDFAEGRRFVANSIIKLIKTRVRSNEETQ